MNYRETPPTPARALRIAGRELPPACRVRFRLRLTSRARFHFHHGGVLRGLLSRALGRHELPDGLIPFAGELGRVAYEAGDAYHLGVTLLGDSRSLADELEDGLRRLGARRHSGPGPPPVLGGNFELASADEVAVADPSAIAAAWEDRRSVPVRFLAPLRLKRPAELLQKGAAFVNQDCFPADHFLERLWNRLFRVTHGRWPEAAERESMPALGRDLAATPQGLVWLDVPIRGARQKNRPYTLGGVLGTVVFSGLSAEWLHLLAAGRLVHAGSDASYGFGAYELAGPEPLGGHPFAPARSFLESAAELPSLESALDHILADSAAAGSDGIAPEDFADERQPRLTKLSAELCDGRYRPPALAGWFQRKDDGGLRPLAIPTVGDRAAQRSAGQVLGASIDALLEDCSYAYRKGYSRAGAAWAIQRAYDQGYRYVLDADIEAFFDSVDLDRLSAKLRALYPFEPLVPLLERWMRAPVVFDGRTIARDRGVPQGSPVSPLLANLYLDELDEEILDRDYRLVRYADDFVVLTKSLERARQAREDVSQALERLDLRLNEDETAVRSMNDGFGYLGYIFCRSMVLPDVPGESEEGTAIELSPEDVPAVSWLAQVPFNRLRALVETPSGRARKKRLQAVPLAPAAAPESSYGRPLYVTDPRSQLRLSDGALEIEGPGTRKRKLPLNTLSHVVFCGRTRATVPLLLSLAAEQVPAYFCRPNGDLTAALAPHEPDWTLWSQQAAAAGDAELRLRWAREIVAAKLHNQATLVRRFHWSEEDRTVSELRDLERQAIAKSTLDALLGLEGRGSKIYFESLADSLPDGWGFDGRQRRPPPDPVNAMLSYAYSMLYRHLATALEIRGLNPRIGLFHQQKGTHEALASDLVEEMRWLADALVWALIRRGQIDPSDFEPSPDLAWPCLLRRRARRTFLEAFEGRLQDEFTPPGYDEPVSYRVFLADQALAVRRLVCGELDRYQPLRLRA